MKGEFLSLEDAEKIANYDKLLTERNNIVKFLKNSIKMYKNNAVKYKEQNNKAQVYFLKSKLSLAQELLHLMNEDK